jgi:hypothetical protein
LSHDGNTLAVGVTNASAAWVDIYTRSTASSAAATWTGQARVLALAPHAGDRFGSALALSGDGNTLVVGAPADVSCGIGVGASPADAGTVASGAVTVYVRSGNSWTAQAFIKPGSADVAAEFGAAVALSEDGNWLAVGAPREANDTRSINGTGCTTCRPDSGAVSVYQRNAQGQWGFKAYIKAANADAGDHFGHALAISNDGRVLVVGAPFEDSAGVAISDRPDDDSSPDQGAAYVFRRRADDSWYQHQYMKQQAGAPGRNWYGYSVAMGTDARYLAIGVPRIDTGGAVVGQWAADEERCACQGSVDIYRSGPDSNFTTAEFGDFRYVFGLDGRATGDRFGWRVALSSSGATLAIAAPGDDGGERGLDGPLDNEPDVVNAGAVYMFFVQSKDLWFPTPFGTSSRRRRVPMPCSAQRAWRSAACSLPVTSTPRAAPAPCRSTTSPRASGRRRQSVRVSIHQERRPRRCTAATMWAVPPGPPPSPPSHRPMKASLSAPCTSALASSHALQRSNASTPGGTGPSTCGMQRTGVVSACRVLS